jgi:hypothetical protein
LPRASKSTHQILKDSNFSSKVDFMRSHGLKEWEHDDFQEANRILDGYRDIDAEGYGSDVGASERRGSYSDASVDGHRARTPSDYGVSDVESDASEGVAVGRRGSTASVGVRSSSSVEEGGRRGDSSSASDSDSGDEEGSDGSDVASFVGGDGPGSDVEVEGDDAYMSDSVVGEDEEDGDRCVDDDSDDDEDW